MASFNFCFLTCLQVSQESGKVVCYSHLFQNFPVCCDPHSQRLWRSQWSRSRCFSGILLLFLWSNGCWQFDLWFLCIFSIQLEHLEFLSSHTAEELLGEFWALLCSMWDECNCVVIWTFFGIAFLWGWNENWTFLVLWPLLSFPNLLTYWVQHFHSIIFQDLK